MASIQPKEAADVVQELEDMDVLAVVCVHQMVVRPGHSCKDSGHHDEGEDCQPATPYPAVVHSVGCCVVTHQLQSTSGVA